MLCSLPVLGQNMSLKKGFPRQKNVSYSVLLEDGVTPEVGPQSEKHEDGSEFASLCAITWGNSGMVGTQSWGFCHQVKKPHRLLKVDHGCCYCSDVFFLWSRQCNWTWDTPVGKAAFPVQMIVKWNLRRTLWQILLVDNIADGKSWSENKTKWK